MKKLGNSDIQVSAIGMGCWAIGGPVSYKGNPSGWGVVDDNESIRAINTAYDCGITFFDTAIAYGAGHSEIVLGKALKDKRDKVVIASKFGYPINEEENKYWKVDDFTVTMLEEQLNNSLRRLQTDYLDLFQLHIPELAVKEAALLFERLEKFVQEGKIRSFGWSTDDLARMKAVSEYKNCVAIQNRLNVFDNDRKVQEFLAEKNISSINRSPLARGFLSGKYTKDSAFAKNDFRVNSSRWRDSLTEGTENFNKIEAIRELLRTDGRSLVHGALGWIMGVSTSTLPIPGIRTVEQALENSKAIEFGPLPSDVVDEINQIIGY